MKLINDTLSIIFALQKAIDIIVPDKDKKRVVVFLPGYKKRVSVTRVHFKNAPQSNEKYLTVQIGKPNYREREFLKLCKKTKTQPGQNVWINLFPKS
jgi:hypothetical protein